MENFKYVKGNINNEKKIIRVELIKMNNCGNSNIEMMEEDEENNGDTKEIYIDVNSTKNDEFILNLIDIVNRHYSATMFDIERSETVEQYGCLTSNVLGLENFPLTFMNAKYILNIFLQLLQCLFRDNDLYLQLCKRDEKSLKIPTSEMNMSFLMKEVMNTCINDDIINDDDDDDFVDIKDLFLVMLHYISNLSINNKKKMNNSKIQKNINIVGGVRNVKELFQNNDNNNNLQDNINETLHQTGDTIHKLMYDYREEIFKNETCRKELQILLKWIVNDPKTYLYQNVNISFKFMMQFVSNVFNALFIEILPKTSMTNCLYATLYQASVSYELNILQHNSKFIQIPLLYRLIYSFYQCQGQPKMTTDDEISCLVDKLCRSKNQRDIDTICKIALKVNIQDTDQLNMLFWLLNDRRGYTYEFYIIILMSLYVMSKCQNLSKVNKISNCQTFGQPLYDLMHKFFIYVTHELKDLNAALCGETLDNFSLLHGKDIKMCLKKFFSNVNHTGQGQK